MSKYFDIHVNHGNGDGYSIPIISDTPSHAVEKARSENMFQFEYDFEDIDSVTEIDEESYNQMIS